MNKPDANDQETLIEELRREIDVLKARTLRAETTAQSLIATLNLLLVLVRTGDANYGDLFSHSEMMPMRKALIDLMEHW